MRFVVESAGTLATGPHEPVARGDLQQLFDRLAAELARVSELEADVAINLATGEVDFFIVVESAGPKDALLLADGVVTEALKAAGVGEPVDWDELHARRADLVPALTEALRPVASPDERWPEGPLTRRRRESLRPREHE